MLTSNKKTVFFIITLAAVIRLYIAVATPVIGTDSYNWITAAKLFSEGQYNEALKQPTHPLYPIFVSVCNLVAGDYEVSGKAVSIIFGVLTVFILYRLTRDLFGHDAACLSSLFLAINPSHVRLSTNILSDATYIFFFLTTLWFILKVHRERVQFYYYPAIGLAIFFAFTTRAEGICLLPIALAWLFFLNWRVKKFKLIKNIVLLFFLLSVFIFTAAGYLMFVHKAEPEKLLNGKGFSKGPWSITQQLAASYFTGSAKVEIPSVDDPNVKARTLLKGRPPSYVLLAQWKEDRRYDRILFYVINEYIKACYYSSVIFIFLGIFRLFQYTSDSYSAQPNHPQRTKDSTRGYVSSVLTYVWGSVRLRRAALDHRAENLLLALFVLYFFIFFKFAYSALYFSGRYVMPLTVLSLIWAGVGLMVASEYLAPRIDKLRNLRISSQTAMIILVLLLLATTLPKSLKIKRQKGRMQKVAGKWIKENFPELKDPLIFGSQAVAFYANGSNKEIRKETSYSDLVSAPCLTEADFLAFYKEDYWNVNTETFDKIKKGDIFIFIKEWIDNDGGKERHLQLYKINSSHVSLSIEKGLISPLFEIQ